ncbi:YceD family protein [Acholeplasma hippikon]|uniref:Uncharacterized ACR, COG1399 n=1 Tax=Acholeplasma hippikon TaxID=264636 RepID=A0A449BIK6_9MOLU|nr:hypothetical protein [Acholeplasma hippikon]VEU82294.1 Uncharacterized ACR, COG1399 [Acholeplasma hippikon]
MKIIVKELEPVTSINQGLDLSTLIPNAEDLVALNNVQVEGKIYKKQGEVKFNLEVKAEVVQKCTISLLPVTYDLAFDTELTFSEDEETYDYILEDEIDLGQVIFAEILIEKEPFVYHESADLDKFLEPEKTGHPAFEGLKKKYDV